MSIKAENKISLKIESSKNNMIKSPSKYKTDLLAFLRDSISPARVRSVHGDTKWLHRTLVFGAACLCCCHYWSFVARLLWSCKGAQMRRRRYFGPAVSILHINAKFSARDFCVACFGDSLCFFVFQKSSVKKFVPFVRCVRFELIYWNPAWASPEEANTAEEGKVEASFVN